MLGFVRREIMARCMIRIIKRPDGEAPSAVRDAWIGLVLPVHDTSEKMHLVQVVSERPARPEHDSHAVQFEDAMNVLGKKSPAARDWWQNNTRGMNHLVFQPDCCEVLPD
jgi:hypothetical protein